MSFLLRYFTRKEWTANRADPTQVTQWKSKDKRLTLVASWGVDAKLTLFGHTWHTYDNRFFVALFGALEAAHETREAERENDSMGRLADYI